MRTCRLTVGYRSSLTEIVQIIGRAARNAPGKTRARFTNLIAEPDATEEVVTEAVNDTLKAIAASLLMEQVLAPRFEFRPKHPNNAPTPGLDYGAGGYDPEKCNVGSDPGTDQIQLEIKGLAEPKSEEAERICREDLTELVTAFVQDKRTIERGPVRRGPGAGGADAGAYGQDREREVPQPQRGGPGGRPATCGRGPESRPASQKRIVCKRWRRSPEPRLPEHRAHRRRAPVMPCR